MKWLERAKHNLGQDETHREKSHSLETPTAITAKTPIFAVMAVPHLKESEKTGGSNRHELVRLAPRIIGVPPFGADQVPNGEVCTSDASPGAVAGRFCAEVKELFGSDCAVTVWPAGTFDPSADAQFRAELEALRKANAQVYARPTAWRAR